MIFKLSGDVTAVADDISEFEGVSVFRNLSR
jgi:hypothetical protein